MLSVAEIDGGGFASGADRISTNRSSARLRRCAHCTLTHPLTRLSAVQHSPEQVLTFPFVEVNVYNSGSNSS